MGSKTIGVGCFFAGVVVGVAATYTYLQNWVNDKIHEEIQAYREKKSEEKKAAKKESRTRAEDEPDDYDENAAARNRLKKDTEELVNLYSNRTREKGGYGGFIQVVPPVDFENFESDPKYEDYERIYLTYYYDNVLVETTTKDLVLDLRSTVGVHFDDHFEDYDDGEMTRTCCYIRNDKLKIFYEITKDLRTYKEALGNELEE